MGVQIPVGMGNFEGEGRYIVKWKYRPRAAAMRPFVKLLGPLVNLRIVSVLLS